MIEYLQQSIKISFISTSRSAPLLSKMLWCPLEPEPIDGVVECTDAALFAFDKYVFKQ